MDAALAKLLPGRPFRRYPALLSTQADALAWAREGGPAGAVVVAEYQASPRGRAGFEWQVRPGVDLAFSLVLRPRLPVEREGWLYTVFTSGLADLLGPEAKIEWPDGVRLHGTRAASAGLHVELGPDGTEWAVGSVLLPDAGSARGELLARAVEAIEARERSSAVPVLADYLRRCETIGRTVCARLIPLGPGGPQVTGRAVNALADGSLVLETQRGSRVAVRPQNLAILEDLG